MDGKVFIRSMGARGHLGGLSLAAREAIRLLGAFGFDQVILETVGVGQSELEVARVVAELRTMINMAPKTGWRPPIVPTVATRGEGVEGLWEAVLQHRKHLESSGRARELVERRLRDETAEVAAEIARERTRRALDEDAALAERLLREGTPYRTAE